MIDLHRAVRRARLTIYIGLGLLVLYGVWRFDVVRLPEEGISPVDEFSPGDRLILDRHFGSVDMGDVVLFRGEGEEILLGRVAPPPPSASAEMWEAIEGGAVWILGDRRDVPVRDSRILGPIEPERILARVSFAVPW